MMMTISGAGRGESPQRDMRVKTGMHGGLTHLMLVKRQIDFQIDLLESALELYKQAFAKKAQQSSELNSPSGGRVGETLTEVLASTTGGQGAKVATDDDILQELQQAGGALAALFKGGVDAETKHKLSVFLKMKKEMQLMREQMSKMTAQKPQEARQAEEAAKKRALSGTAQEEERTETAGVLPMRKALEKKEEEEIIPDELMDTIEEIQALTKESKLNPAKNAPPLPDWRKDPAAWTLWLINWLVTAKVLPEAFAQLQMYAEEANFHNKEMDAVREIEYLLARMENKKSLIPSKYLKYFLHGSLQTWLQHASWWNEHPSLVNDLYSDVKPMIRILSSLKKDVANYGSDKDVGKFFLNLYSDFKHLFGSKGIFLKGSIYKFIQAIQQAYNGTLTGVMFWEFPRLFNSFYKRINVKEFITSNGHEVRNPYWKSAFNNINNSGPWANVNNDFSQVGNKLTNLSTTDQTNLRESFFGLTTKVNASASILTTTGQMLHALAQNIRTSA